MTNSGHFWWRWRKRMDDWHHCALTGPVPPGESWVPRNTPLPIGSVERDRDAIERGERVAAFRDAIELLSEPFELDVPFEAAEFLMDHAEAHGRHATMERHQAGWARLILAQSG